MRGKGHAPRTRSTPLYQSSPKRNNPLVDVSQKIVTSRSSQISRWRRRKKYFDASERRQRAAALRCGINNKLDLAAAEANAMSHVPNMQQGTKEERMRRSQGTARITPASSQPSGTGQGQKNLRTDVQAHSYLRVSARVSRLLSPEL